MYNLKQSRNFLISVISAFLFTADSFGLPAFPGAEGFGADTPGGRGGRVIAVTSLADTGPGSFRAACEAAGPRVIVFKVHGIIKLTTGVLVDDPFLTIAGQTAPGDGIALRAAALTIGTHDVVVRCLRFRVGDDPDGQKSNERDGITVSSTKTGQDIYNVIIDHCSVAWGVDENISTWTDQVHDVTFQWCITAEALHNSIHIDEGDTVPGAHSKGMILGKNISNVSVHHCLFAHNVDRNPYIAGVINCEFVNNVVYNWGDGPAKTTSDKNVVHFIENYFKRGGSGSRYDCFRFSDTPAAGTAVYLHNNWRYDPANDPGSGQYWSIVNGDASILADTLQFTPSNIIVHPVSEAYDLVLEGAGARIPVRDTVDKRAVDDTRNGVGQRIDSQAEVGGWPVYAAGIALLDTDSDGMPDTWEQTNSLSPDDSTDGIGTDLSPEGYTNLEVYINSLLEPNTPVSNATSGDGYKENRVQCPNPFYNNGEIIFKGNPCPVFIFIYNMQGMLQRKLIPYYTGNGITRAVWDKKGDDGKSVSEGLYIIKLICNSYNVKCTIVLVN